MKKSYVFYKLKQSLRLLKEVKNPLSSFLFYVGLKGSVTVKSKKVGSFDFDSTQRDLCHSLLLLLPYLKETNYNKCRSFFSQCSAHKPVIELDKYNVAYEECGMFAEHFGDYPYNVKNIAENDVIIDIGSNVGDTALDFASKGLIVYGFEPVRELYEISLKNAQLNPHLKDRINLFNYAVSNRRGRITIDALDSTAEYVNSGDSYEIEAITLEDILNKYSISPKLLNMDCEGCEFDIIRNEDLSIFDEIIFEHHAGLRDDDYESLVKILKDQGFEVDLIPLWILDMDDIGIIHAYKQ